MTIPLRSAPSSRWQAGLCGTAYGVRVGCRVDQAPALELLHPSLPPGWRPAPPGPVDRLYSWCVACKSAPTGRPSFHRLYAGRRQLLRTADPEEILERLESDLQLYIAATSPGYVFVHAGVVGWQGRAILIPGRSYAGKSTLVAALLRAGAVYYSDEYAVLDPQGCVHPYPRRLSLRQPCGQRPLRCPSEALGSSSGTIPLPVGLAVLTRYRPGAPWRPRPLSPGQAVLMLLNHTVPVRRRPEAALDTLRHVVAQARVVCGPRGEAEEAARYLLGDMGSRGPALPANV